MASFRPSGNSSLQKEENNASSRYGKKNRAITINPYDSIIPKSQSPCVVPSQTKSQATNSKLDRNKKHQKSDFLKSPNASKEEDSINNLLADLSLSSNDNNTERETGSDNAPVVLYYAWFFNEEVCGALKEISVAYITQCYFSVPQFERFLTSACEKNGGKDPLAYYRYPSKKRKVRHHPDYHVTSKFCGREKLVCEEYWLQVEHLVGTSSPLHVIGIFFTEKTCGFRIKLSENQKQIFDERSVSPTPSNSSGNSSFLNESHSDTGEIASNSGAQDNDLDPNGLSGAKAQQGHSHKARKNSSSNSTFKQQKYVKSEYHPDILVGPQEKDFCPTKSRAHITIGTSPLVNAVQAGEDLKDLVNLEARSSSSAMFHKDYVLENGDTLRQFGRFGDAFILYFNNMFIVDGVFNFKE